MSAILVELALGLAVATTVPIAVLPLQNRVRPSLLVPLLAAGSLTSAASLGVVLTLLALAVLGRVPAVADLGGWSVDTLASAVPVTPALGVGAAALTAVLVGRTLRRAGRILLVLGRSDRLSRRLSRGGGQVVIVDDDAADAFTLAGLKGCVVISRGLLQALGPAERRMVTAHEMSHLRHRHHLYVHAVDLAVAANPLLHRASAAVRLGVERWADEDAARLTGDRTAAAAALARVALVRSLLRRATAADLTRPVAALGVAGAQVAVRARALLAPAPRGGGVATCVGILLIATIAATIASSVQIHGGFEVAEAAWVSIR